MWPLPFLHCKSISGPKRKKEEGKHYGKLKKIFHQANFFYNLPKILYKGTPPKIFQDIHYNSITINLKFQTQVKKINHLSKILILKKYRPIIIYYLGAQNPLRATIIYSMEEPVVLGTGGC